MNVNNKFSVNTTGILCPYYGDLSLAPTPSEIISTSTHWTHYVVVTQLTQPITCCSSLNVSGLTKFLSNAPCIGDLYVNGVLRCNYQVFNGNSIYNGAFTYYSSLNLSGTTTVNDYLVINNNGAIAYSFLGVGVGSNYKSSFISMVEKSDMYFSTRLICMLNKKNQ